MMMNEEAMTNEEAIKLLSQVMDAILASNSWLPSTDNPIKECFGMAIEALKAQEAAGDTISRQAAIDAVEFGITYAKAINKSTGEVKELFKEGNKALNEAVERLKELPPAQPEVKQIGYQECANAMLKMWMDKVITDGEYNRIMDKLNSYWRRTDESD